MNKTDFNETLLNNICLMDTRISLDAKGLYYTLLMNAYNNNPHLQELVKNSYENEEFIFNLIIELIKYNHIVIGIPINKDDIFYFNNLNIKE